MHIQAALSPPCRLLWIIGLSMLTQPALAALCPERPIRLAFFETPMLYADGKGLDRDFVDELQRRSKCRFVTEVMPRARVWKELENGQLDMTTSVLPTPEREQSMWVLNYFQLRSYVILSRPQAGHIKSLEEFLTAPKPLIFGRVRGYKHGAALDAWIGQLEEQGRVHDVAKT
ncbi:MAG TPA: hypothetical protein PLW86_01310, partial [Rhodocyclaceae bacterium]|nr:hypothetical protein [Rhodocyclaceae bacterium]